MPGDEPANIFISHKHTDSEIAHALNRAIEELFEKRVSVSYSKKLGEGGIPPGADWFRWIGEQVQRSQVTVVLLTPRFVADPEWLLWETGAVYGSAPTDGDGQPRVLPLRYRVDDDRLPAPLEKAHFQMANGDSAEDMEEFLSSLHNDFDVLDKQESIAAGRRLDGIVKTYVEEVERVLDAPASAALAGRPPDRETLKELLALTVTAVRALDPSAELNGRYFYADTKAGRDLLVRDEDIYHETVSMPDEFGLSEVDIELDAETIVICKSFLKRQPLYEVLEQERMERYRDEIADQISEAQGWVLACPVLVPDARPLGVVCLYGKEPLARNEEDEQALLKVAMKLSWVFRRALSGSRG